APGTAELRMAGGASEGLGLAPPTVAPVSAAAVAITHSLALAAVVGAVLIRVAGVSRRAALALAARIRRAEDAGAPRSGGRGRRRDSRRGRRRGDRRGRRRGRRHTGVAVATGACWTTGAGVVRAARDERAWTHTAIVVHAADLVRCTTL